MHGMSKRHTLSLSCTSSTTTFSAACDGEGTLGRMGMGMGMGMALGIGTGMSMGISIGIGAGIGMCTGMVCIRMSALRLCQMVPRLCPDDASIVRSI